MPLIFKEQMGDVLLALWRITEAPEELCSRVTPADVASAEGFASVARRTERLAWRALLREFMPEGDVLYDACGAPRIAGSPGYVGVSHTPGMAALVLSPRRCAVDIERAGRDPGRLAARYLSEDELRLPGGETPLFRTAAWCAKEVLYKFSGRKGLELLRDVRITAADLGEGRLEGTVAGGDPVRMRILRPEGFVVVHTL